MTRRLVRFLPLRWNRDGGIRTRDPLNPIESEENPVVLRGIRKLLPHMLLVVAEVRSVISRNRTQP